MRRSTEQRDTDYVGPVQCTPSVEEVHDMAAVSSVGLLPELVPGDYSEIGFKGLRDEFGIRV